ncbi:MAG: iron-siderophore ABC transporter substrate-binding protein [Cyanobacteria bacterium P01_A01_bin.17]
MRIVDHALGETRVPVNPQRIVVLTGSLDTVLALGVKPVGSVEILQENHLENEVKGVESIGSPRSPNLEAIVALNPDLILGTDWDKGIYETLSQIAPTVIAEVDSSGEWKELLYTYADALGETDKAEQIMADYDARIEEFRMQMGDRLQETEVSIVNIYQGIVQLYLADSFSGTIVADAELPRPHHQTNTDQKFSMNISKELLHMADGDAMFVWIYDINKEVVEDDQATLKELKADPLWLKLNAVQKDRVYDVPGSHWIGMGPIAANLVLDDLFEYLVDSPSQSAQ